MLYYFEHQTTIHKEFFGSNVPQQLWVDQLEFEMQSVYMQEQCFLAGFNQTQGFGGAAARVQQKSG